MAKKTKKTKGNQQKPLYVAKKSLVRAIFNWKLLFFWLIIPLIMIIVDIIKLKCKNVEFYDGYVVQHSGVIAKDEMRTIFPHIVGIKVDRTFWGAIFNYGDVLVDVIGSWDISLSGVKKPGELRKFLETRMMTVGQVNSFSQRAFVQE